MTENNTSDWINFLKGFAIAEIVAFHFFGDHAINLALNPATLSTISNAPFSALEYLTVQLTRIGSQGIHIFFFLSGFGLALSESTNKRTALTFLRRRLSRVYPGYLVAVAFVLLLLLISGMKDANWQLLSNALRSIFLIQNYSSESIRSINGNWWFISALVPMYFTYVGLRKALLKHPMRWLILAFLMSLSYKVAISVLLTFGYIRFEASQLNPFTAFSLNYWWEFIAGVAFFHLGGLARMRAFNKRQWSLITACALIFELAGIWLGSSTIGRIYNDDFFAIAQILLLSTLFAFLRIWMANRITNGMVNLLCLIGPTSYGIYLIHQPISRALLHFGVSSTFLAGAIAIFFIYFAACWMIGVILERIAAVAVAYVTTNRASA